MIIMMMELLNYVNRLHVVALDADVRADAKIVETLQER
jgi:hypothetical protein